MATDNVPFLNRPRSLPSVVPPTTSNQLPRKAKSYARSNTHPPGGRIRPCTAIDALHKTPITGRSICRACTRLQSSTGARTQAAANACSTCNRHSCPRPARNSYATTPRCADRHRERADTRQVRSTKCIIRLAGAVRSSAVCRIGVCGREVRIWEVGVRIEGCRGCRCCSAGGRRL